VLRFSLSSTRLFRKADFSALFREGRRKVGPFFVVYFRPLGALDLLKSPRRFGLVVGKKATITNVKRNLVKRVIREVYRQQQHDLLDYQIMVVAKKGLKPVPAAALRAELLDLLEQISALK
jgi:ribonuclease P protein component